MTAKRPIQSEVSDFLGALPGVLDEAVNHVPSELRDQYRAALAEVVPTIEETRAAVDAGTYDDVLDEYDSPVHRLELERFRRAKEELDET